MHAFLIFSAGIRTFIPNEAFRGFPPLHLFIKQLSNFLFPDSSNSFCLGTIPRGDLRLELDRVDKDTVCQIVHIWHNFYTGLCITSPAKIERPQESRDGEVHRALGDVCALAEASAGAKGKVVAFAHVRVKGGLDCSLFIVGPAAGVECSWVRMPLGAVIDAPNRVCEYGGGGGAGSMSQVTSSVYSFDDVDGLDLPDVEPDGSSFG